MTKTEMAVAIGGTFGFRCTSQMLGSVFKTHGISSGRTGRFEPGHVPVNSGKKGLNGKSATSFKKGHRPHNWKPVGTERIVLGLVEVKVSEPKTWRSKHSIIWEKANGPIPPGHVVIFADGDRLNFEEGNLMLVSREELAVMNKKSLITDNAEATKVGKTIAQLAMACRRRKSRSREQ